MKQLPLDPRLQLADGQFDIQRMNDWMRDAAKVSRELQTPPVCNFQLGNNQNLTGSGGNEVVNFDTATLDSHSGCDTTNHRYYFRRTGYHRISVQLAVATTLATDAVGYINAYIRISGTAARNSYIYHANLGKQEIVTLDLIRYCYANDGAATPEYTDVIVVETPTGYTLDSSLNRTYMHVQFLGAAPLR